MHHVICTLGKLFDKKYVVVTVKHPPNQMIWGAMSCRGAAGLYYIPPNTTMNGPKYVELLIGAVVMSSANGLVGTGFASRYRLQPRAGYF